MSDLLTNNTTNPGTPASAKTKYWTSSSTKRLQFTDDTGVTGPVGAGPSNWINVTQQGTNSILAGAGAQATANVTNLNAIIAAAPSGSTIYFPTGIWQFNGVLTTLPSNLTFQGEFGGTQIYIIANLAGNFITCNAAAGYTAFKDMEFLTTVAQTAGAIIETGNGYGVLIERCNLTGNAGGAGTTLFNGISMTGTASGNAVRINDCVITSFSNVGILAAANSFGQFMVLNTILNDTVANGLASIQLLGGGALQLINCDMFGAQYGLALQPSGTVASVQCVQTYFDTCTTRALICGGAGTVTRCEFTSCWFTTGGTASTAIEVTTTGAGIHTGLAFRDCTIWNVNGTTGTTNGALVSAVNDISFTDCLVSGWTNGIQVTPTSPNGTTKLNIVGCTVGAAGSVAANTTGILLNAGAVQFGQISIQSNSFNGNTTHLTDNSTQALATSRFVLDNAGLTTAPKAIIATSGAINTTETYIPTAVALPANGLLPGTTLRLTLNGTCTTTIGNISTFTARVGTTGTTPASDTTATAALVTTAAGTTGTNIPFTTTILITCRAIGASTLLQCSMMTTSQGATGMVAGVTAGTALATGTFNNNTALFLNVSYKSAATTTTSTFQTAAWEVLAQ